MNKGVLPCFVVLLLLSCGRQDAPPDDEQADDATPGRYKAVELPPACEENADTRRQGIEPVSTCSPAEVMTNVHAFGDLIDRSRVDDEMKSVNVTRLTKQRAVDILKNEGKRRFAIGDRVSLKCRDFAAGNFYLSNLYNIYMPKNAASMVGTLWGNFAMRHGDAKLAVEIFDRAFHDAVKSGEPASAISHMLSDKVCTLNMAQDFEASLSASLQYFDYASEHAGAPHMKYQYEWSLYLYLQALYNNGEYRAASEVYDENRDGIKEQTPWFAKDGLLGDIRKESKFKHVLSHGFGGLAE